VICVGSNRAAEFRNIRLAIEMVGTVEATGRDDLPSAVDTQAAV